jgi:sugar/nucleoside kinase (ribokinase family)
MYDLFLEYVSPQTIRLEVDDTEVDYILLEEGRKIELKELLFFIGGGAINSACSFARLGFTTAACAKIGNDEYGAFIRDELTKSKIDSTYVIATSQIKTGCSFIIPSPTGNKAVLIYRGANTKLTAKDIPIDHLQQVDCIYITSLSYDTSTLLPIIAKTAQKLRIPIATNPGTSQLCENTKTLIDTLPTITILVLNCFESTLLMKQFGYSTKKHKKCTKNKKLPDLLSAPITRGDIHYTLHDYFREIHTRGPKIAVVTNGADGVYISDGTTIYYHPSLPIEVISTVGAGDAFASTFVAQLLKKKSIENAIRAGIINSAAVLEHLGATTGLLDQQELDELVSEIDQNGIKTFPLN